MRVGLALAALALAAACHDAPTAPTAPVRVDLSRGWLRASPGEVGMSAPGLLGAAGDASGIPRFRSLLVARHGRLVAERSEEHTSELQSPCNLVCRLLLEKKKKNRGTRHRVSND